MFAAVTQMVFVVNARHPENRRRPLPLKARNRGEAMQFRAMSTGGIVEEHPLKLELVDETLR